MVAKADAFEKTGISYCFKIKNPTKLIAGFLMADG